MQYVLSLCLAAKLPNTPQIGPLTVSRTLGRFCSALSLSVLPIAPACLSFPSLDPEWQHVLFCRYYIARYCIWFQHSTLSTATVQLAHPITGQTQSTAHCHGCGKLVNARQVKGQVTNICQPRHRKPLSPQAPLTTRSSFFARDGSPLQSPCLRSSWMRR